MVVLGLSKVTVMMDERSKGGWMNDGWIGIVCLRGVVRRGKRIVVDGGEEMFLYTREEAAGGRAGGSTT